MAQISKKWLLPDSVDETKIDSATLGDGLTGGSGEKIAVNVGDGLKIEEGKIVLDFETADSKTLDQFTIGESKSEDGGDDSLADGLLDFTSTTNAAVAMDQINEILLALAPAQPATLTNISGTTSGTAGKLSFGASNAITDYTNVPSTDVGGSVSKIINASTAVAGVLNSTVTANSAGAYPAYSFKNGDKGTLSLKVNGTIVHTVDLTTFTSGSTVNANGSGFTLTAATGVSAASGTIDAFKYRTGTYTVAAADLSKGYNAITVIHSEVGSDTSSATWVVDNATTATTITGAALGTFNMTGSYYLSGVRYHTAGTVGYSATISNAYRNTYSSSASAIAHATKTNCSIANISLSTPTTEADDVNLSQTATIVCPSNSRYRAASSAISINTTVLRTIQGSVTGGLISGGSVLIENGVGQFGVETARIQNLDTLLTGTVTSWDSTESLLDNDGLQFVDGAIKYPTENFGNDRYTDGYADNPSYTTCSGARSVVLEFSNSLAAQNFTLGITGTSSSDYVTAASFSATGTKLKVELCIPNGTSDGTDYEWKDCMVNHDGNDANIGCKATSYGATVPTAWGLTAGGVSTSVSNKKWYIRITAGSAWIGSITAVTCVRV